MGQKPTKGQTVQTAEGDCMCRGVLVNRFDDPSGWYRQPVAEACSCGQTHSYTKWIDGTTSWETCSCGSKYRVSTMLETLCDIELVDMGPDSGYKRHAQCDDVPAQDAKADDDDDGGDADGDDGDDDAVPAMCLADGDDDDGGDGGDDDGNDDFDDAVDDFDAAVLAMWLARRRARRDDVLAQGATAVASARDVGVAAAAMAGRGGAATKAADRLPVFDKHQLKGDHIIFKNDQSSIHSAVLNDKKVVVKVPIEGDVNPKEIEAMTELRGQRRIVQIVGLCNFPKSTDARSTRSDGNRSSKTEQDNQAVNECIVMEIIGGGSLADQIQQGATWSLVQVLEMGVAVCEALEAVHRAGFVHSDVKPSNLMGPISDVKLVDFGLSERQSITMCRWRAAGGTAFYMAPEGFQHNGYGPAIDIYALGVALWECFYHKPPYSDFPNITTVKQLKTAVCYGRLRPTIPDKDKDSKLAGILRDTWADECCRPTASLLKHRLLTLLAEERITGTSSSHPQAS
eukprot:TRINITY_DN5754_c0_g1_i1.p1 TRINITY_DN5754_c0_g1~~TRINITY_DN5754_c0_g1_i1.p1  ORF type:complete len:513 (+),score=160.49 TRINITY_DN5754_c0_g1_i1:274-1812(+)